MVARRPSQVRCFKLLSMTTLMQYSVTADPSTVTQDPITITTTVGGKKGVTGETWHILYFDEANLSKVTADPVTVTEDPVTITTTVGGKKGVTGME
jgi:hypothetical protein